MQKNLKSFGIIFVITFFVLMAVFVSLEATGTFKISGFTENLASSITYSSPIKFDDGTQSWNVGATINGIDTIRFSKNVLSQTTNNGSVQANDGVNMTFTPSQPICGYELYPQHRTIFILGVPIGNVDYFTVSRKSLEVPYTIRVYFDNPGKQVFTYAGSASTATNNLDYVINALGGGNAQFRSSNGGIMNITNIGAIRTGNFDCPEASSVAFVIDSQGKITAYDRANYEYTISNTTQTLWNALLNKQPQTLASDWLNVSPQFAAGSTQKVVVYLNQGQYSANINLQFDTKFADAVFVKKQKIGVPLVVLSSADGTNSLTKSLLKEYSFISSLDPQSDSSTYKVLISQSGSAGSITNQTSTITLQPGQSETKNFTFLGINPQTEQICVQLVSQVNPSIFSNKACNMITVNPIPEPIRDVVYPGQNNVDRTSQTTNVAVAGTDTTTANAGNRVIEDAVSAGIDLKSEEISCSEGTHLVAEKSPILIFGFIPTGNYNTTKTCVDDFPVVTIILFAIVILLSLILTALWLKKPLRRKRR